MIKKQFEMLEFIGYIGGEIEIKSIKSNMPTNALIDEVEDTVSAYFEMKNDAKGFFCWKCICRKFFVSA